MADTSSDDFAKRAADTLAAARSAAQAGTNPNLISMDRILIFDHTAALGGGEIALLNLVRELQTGPFDVQVLLGAPGPLAVKLAAIGVSPHILRLDPSVGNTRKDSLGAGSLLHLRQMASIIRYARRLARFLRQRKIDVIHTNSLKSDIIGAIAGRLAGVPVIWHVRDRICREYLPLLAVLGFRTLARILPTCLVANSAATMATLPRRKRSHIVHDGVDRLPTLPVTPRVPGNHPVIGIVGRIAPWKGQHIFLQAAAEVIKLHPGARFQIVGAPLFSEQEYEQEIRTLARTLGLQDAVEFTGFRSDIPELIQAMDIVVHASIIGEPFGQVVIEAMAAAKPVVATRGGGVPEIVVDGQSGLLVPMGDAHAMANAICAFLENHECACLIGNTARNHVKNYFMIHHVARKMEAIYAALCPK